MSTETKNGFIILLNLFMGSVQPVFAEDDGLMFFETEAEAHAAIKEQLNDVLLAIEKGDIDKDCEMTEDDYQVIPATLTGTKISATYEGDNYEMERTDDDWIKV